MSKVEETIVQESANVAEPVKEVTEDRKPKPKKEVTGTVIGCTMLNVRKAANPDAKVLCTIKAASTVVIDEAKSTSGFYKVTTDDGVVGFCMKKYVSIKQTGKR